MRKICLINHNNNSSLSLNLFAKLARQNKRVLIIDLKFSNCTDTNSKVGLNIANCLYENQNPQRYITTLEKNLDIIKGNLNLNVEEFNSFSDLFKLDYFDKKFSKLNYDYLVFEISPILNLLSMNVLMFVSEIITILDTQKHGIEFLHKLSKFLGNFNSLYSKKLFISKVIPTFKNNLDSKKYTYLVSNFSSKMISYPICENKKNKDFAISLNKISSSIIEDQKIFDLNVTSREKQKVIREYLDIIFENSRVEVPLTKF